MTHHACRSALLGVACLIGVMSVHAAQKPANVEGTFTMAGTDARLKYVRAARAMLDDKGKQGYAILISARPALGDFSTWKTAEPSKNGSFIYLMLEAKGEVWVAELGHTASKSGRFGVVTELKATRFEVRGDELVAHITTPGEQEFSANRYSIDLTIETPLEPKK